MKHLLALAVLASLAACSSEPDVEWSRYEIGVRVKLDIDRLARAGDCDSLADRFANAEEGDLLSYITYKMDEAGCT